LDLALALAEGEVGIEWGHGGRYSGRGESASKVPAFWMGGKIGPKMVTGLGIHLAIE
jgi:hypothetical protein